MDSSVQRVTLGDVERRFLAGKSWWATRIGMMFLGAAFAFILALMAGGILAAVVGSAMASVLVPLLVFREDRIFFGTTYKIGALLNPETRNRIWVEQQGELAAHEGTVFVLVRTAGILHPRRFITVVDGVSGDNPFGKPMTFTKNEGFLVERRRSGTARAAHIESVIFLLLEDQRVVRSAGMTS